MTSIVVLNTETYNIKSRSSISKLLSMILDVDFMILTFLKYGFFLIFLDFIVYLRASLQKLYKTKNPM